MKPAANRCRRFCSVISLKSCEVQLPRSSSSHYSPNHRRLSTLADSASTSAAACSPRQVSAAGDAEPELDALDLFSDSLFSLFDHVSPAIGSPLQSYTYTPPPECLKSSLTIRIPPQTINALFAHHVWNASLIMADSISRGELDVFGRTVLELGAGTGIPGLLCAREGAQLVVLSDANHSEMIRNLRENIERGLAEQKELKTRVKALGHNWGESTEELRALSPSGYDCILLADCIWSSYAHDLLVKSLSTLLSRSEPSPFIYLVSGFHSGRAGVRAFLRKAFAAGFGYDGQWEEIGHSGERRMWGWDLVDGEEPAEEVEREADRNRWVVQGKLRWLR